VWVQTCNVKVRRRANGMVLRGVSQKWELKKEPTSDHQLRDMLPVVKEIDGVFLVTGFTMGKVWQQDYPVGGDGKEWINQWTEGSAWEHLKPSVIDRLNAQRAGHQKAPKPVLENEELEPFPRNFHPWLRRGADGFIRLEETAAEKFPSVIADYRTWEIAERRHEREWTPDDLLLAWLSWNEVPVDLRPWFGWDTLFNRPGPLRLQHRNAYETAMCRQALNWWNGWMISGIRDAMTSH